jgi:prepilin-type N-terminal cleavage/methylation domain-containing protein/prepilin-type processing-associated H-X9-DG protein
MIASSAARTRPSRARGFTLVELLVVSALMALLIAILLPSLGMSLGAARKFRCQVSLRSVGFDFGVFADDTLHGDRGNDDDLGERFRLETFQEAEYGLDEFWRWGEKNEHQLPDAENNNPMRCAEVGGEITLRRAVPCSNGAVAPPENVSFGFNGRLHRAPKQGSNRWTAVTLTSSIVDESMVPLAWDVDGAEARRRNVQPVFSAPAGDALTGPFANGSYWFPALRHNGGLNVLFLDQHVEFTTRPLEEPDWRWSFIPRR